MTLKSLVTEWQNKAAAEIADEVFELKLSVEDAAKVDALSDMYPLRSREQIMSELLSAALAELEQSFPYVEGTDVIATDEYGEPVYKAVGPTPEFLDLTKKHFAKHMTRLKAV